MKTFIESMKITHNLVLLKESFVLMSGIGINPNRFVEWYCEEGVLLENSATEKWLADELLLIEGIINDKFKKYAPDAQKIGYAGGKFLGTAGAGAADTVTAGANLGGHMLAGAGKGVVSGINSIYPGADEKINKFGQNVKNFFTQPTGQQNQQQDPDGLQNQSNQQQNTQAPLNPHIKSATEALKSLSLRMNKSAALKQKIGGDAFQSTILKLINMLNNPSSFAMEEPQQQGNVMQFPQQSPVAKAESRFYSTLSKLYEQRLIINGLNDLQKYGINPEEFVEWYREEGRFLNEGWMDGVSDFGGNLWANMKDAWKNRGSGLKNVWNNWGQAGKERQANVDSERDNNSVQNAVKALDELEKEVGQNVKPEFLELINNIKQKLSVQPETPQNGDAEQQQEPEQQPQQQPEPQQPEPQQQNPQDNVQSQDQSGQQNPQDLQGNQKPDWFDLKRPHDSQYEQDPIEGVASSNEFWNSPDTKPQRDALMQQIKSMNFVKDDGTILPIANHFRPNVVIQDLVKRGSTGEYKDSSGQTLQDFLKNWKPQNESTVKNMPSFYQYMARRSL